MLAGLTGLHLLVVAAIVLVLFGATRLPIFAKGLGQTVKVLRTELQPGRASAPAPAAAETPAQ